MQPPASEQVLFQGSDFAEWASLNNTIMGGNSRAGCRSTTNGLLLEGKMTDALIRVATAGKKVFPDTELLAEEDLLEPAQFQGLYDPHVWMDPVSWAKAVVVVRDKLSEYDPDGNAEYLKNAESYLKELAKLDSYAKKVMASIPKDSRNGERRGRRVLMPRNRSYRTSRITSWQVGFLHG